MADKLSEAQREALTDCIDACMKCCSICQNMVDSSPFTSTRASDEEVLDALHRTIAACTTCIKASTEHLSQCVNPAEQEKVQLCILTCQACIQACQDGVRKCETSEQAVSELESGHGRTCVHACAYCIKLCEDCIEACRACLRIHGASEVRTKC
jgi:hypothetical protein